MEDEVMRKRWSGTIRALMTLVMALLLLISVSGCKKGDAAGEGTTVPLTLEEATEAYNSGQFESAAKALEDIVEEDPGDLEARKQLALALAAQGDNEGAIEQYAAVVDADSEDHETLYRLAMLERLIGDSEGAATHLEAAALLDDNPSYRDELARTYMQLGKFVEAAEQWGVLLEDDTISQEQRVLLLGLQADAYANARMYDEAREALEEAVFLAPNDEGLKSRLEALQ